jgi:hypothetical protein
MKGFIDTGSSIVTLRRTVAEELQLQTRPTTQCIRGYAGATTQAIGVAALTLTVDLVTAEVTVFVVADEIQPVSIIIGQSFLNQANVAMVLRNNEIPLFEKNLAALTDLDDLPPRKLALWAKGMTCVTKTMNSGWRLDSKFCSKLKIITPNIELDHVTYKNY